MWHIFPQIKGLGKSSISERYAIKYIEEAKEYINHGTLRKRLIKISQELIRINNYIAKDVFRHTGALKLKPWITLILYMK